MTAQTPLLLNSECLRGAIMRPQSLNLLPINFPPMGNFPLFQHHARSNQHAGSLQVPARGASWML